MENYENPQVDEVLDVDTEEPTLGESLEIANKCDKAGPLDSLLKIIQEEQDKIDARGFADAFKNATEGFFKKIASLLKEDNLGFTPTDVGFGDGYFIFAMGTNSVINFRVKEAPGWLFGIWWSSKEKEEETENNIKTYYLDRVEFDFFAQYEETIDKFKPSASMWEHSGDYWLEKETNDWDLISCAKIVKFIIEHPALAWYRDVHYTNFNYEYVSEKMAEEDFTEWRLKENHKKLIYAENEKVMLDALKYIAGPVIESGEAFIADGGENVSPRYELIILNTGDPKDDGLYRIWDLGYEDADADKEYFETKEKECKERAKDFWWSNPVSSCCNFISKERFEKAKYYHEHPEEDDD